MHQSRIQPFDFNFKTGAKMPPAIPVSTISSLKLTFAAGAVWMRDKILNVSDVSPKGTHIRIHITQDSFDCSINVLRVRVFARNIQRILYRSNVTCRCRRYTYVPAGMVHASHITIYFGNVRCSHV